MDIDYDSPKITYLNLDCNGRLESVTNVSLENAVSDENENTFADEEFGNDNLNEKNEDLKNSNKSEAEDSKADSKHKVGTRKRKKYQY